MINVIKLFNFAAAELGLQNLIYRVAASKYSRMQ